MPEPLDVTIGQIRIVRERVGACTITITEGDRTRIANHANDFWPLAVAAAEEVVRLRTELNRLGSEIAGRAEGYRRLSTLLGDVHKAWMHEASQCDGIMEEHAAISARAVSFLAAPGLAIDSAARPLSEWSEEEGPALWWSFPVVEAPYSGTPLDIDFPEDATHWTQFATPTEPAAEPGEEILPHPYIDDNTGDCSRCGQGVGHAAHHADDAESRP